MVRCFMGSNIYLMLKGGGIVTGSLIEAGDSPESSGLIVRPIGLLVGT